MISLANRGIDFNNDAIVALTDNLQQVFKIFALNTHACFEYCTPLVKAVTMTLFINVVPKYRNHIK